MEDKIRTADGEVSVRVDGDGASAVLVLAHGAGAGMNHPFMTAVAEELAHHDMRVVRFNFLYTERARKAPDRQGVLETTYSDVVAWVRDALGPARLFLGGKSMGGRIASHIAAAGEKCSGLVFLGYPLHPPGRPDRIRDAHLYDITVPMLFVEGTRDPFCPLGRLGEVRSKLSGDNDLLVIEDGDHSFRVRRSSGRTNHEALREVISGVAAWMHELSG